MAESLCGSIVQSKRSLLALGWSVVNILVFLTFLVAFAFSVSAHSSSGYNDDNEVEEERSGEDEFQIAVTSRAMAFTALWTAVLAGMLGIFGTILLGWQSPTGKYYWCCALNVHKTTPMVLGVFVGALLMFSNLTLVCSVLFGEFEIRDYPNDGNNMEENNKRAEGRNDYAAEKSSLAFSIMCMFLTILYGGFAGLVYHYADDLLEENVRDAREEALRPSDPVTLAAPVGYIGSNRFGVSSSGHNTTTMSDGFMSPNTNSTITKNLS